MKKVNILSVAALFALSSHAQNSDLAVRKDIKGLKQEEGTVKQEKKQEKKELRKLEGQEVSYQSKEAFYRDFGDIPATWKRTAFFDEATFINEDQPMIAFYDVSSELVGTTTRKSFSDLPVEGQKYINSKYKDYTQEAVIYYEDNQDNDMDMVMYGTQFDDSDMYFVELKKDNKEIVLMVDPHGLVSYFTQVS